MNDQALPTRACGDCKLCCKVNSVDELGKRAGQWCSSCPGKGCNTYETRPDECREFACLWLLGYLPEEARPDKNHVVFIRRVVAGLEVVEVRESHQGASDTQEVGRLINAFRKKGLGVQAVFNGRCRRVHTPEVKSQEEVQDYLDRFTAAHKLAALSMPIASTD